MEDVRKADPTFTGFTPRTATEAVDRYVRCRKNGLKPMLVPECLIECAKGLDEEEIGLFENWIINPNGSLDGIDLVPDLIVAENEAVYLDICKARDNPAPDPATLPPVPFVDDEKMEIMVEAVTS